MHAYNIWYKLNTNSLKLFNKIKTIILRIKYQILGISIPILIALFSLCEYMTTITITNTNTKLKFTQYKDWYRFASKRMPGWECMLHLSVAMVTSVDPKCCE